jgi:hypothetical protein
MSLQALARVRVGVRRALLRGFALAVAALAALPTMAAEPVLVTKVKAAYLFNLARFVDWPSLPPEEMSICVIDNPALGTFLLELSGRQIKGRVLRIDQDGEVTPDQCQVLYISRTSDQWPELAQQLKGSSVLTVSDRKNFAKDGGIVGFYREGGKIRLEINTGAAREANLKISSKLLELARTIP